MHFTEDEAAEVKSWVVKKLEDISDADSDVLADYVLALVRSDAPDEEIRKASIENLEDFLKDNTVKFVDEIFEKYNPKPQQPPPSQSASTQPSLSLPPQQMPFNQPFSPPNAPFGPGQPVPAPGYHPNPGGGFEGNGTNFGRKRNFNDMSQGPDANGAQYRPGDRPFKAPRGGRRDGQGRGQRTRGAPHYPPPNATNGYPNMQMMSGPGFPFDPNNPVAAMMSLGQSMGLPQLPGMPPLPMGNPEQNRPFSGSPPAKSSERCKDYDTQGFCVLGSTCPYQHGSEHVVAPGQGASEEYDPTKSNIMLPPSGANGSHRGSDRGRGRGRGRGDKGGLPSHRRGRAEYSHVGPNEDQSITTIVVEQIPEDKFSEQAVREFFSEFGEIVEVTLKPYKHLALVKYDNYAAAKRAWSSPKVIFDNRFVKVYWYKPDTKSEANGSHPDKMAVDATPFDQEQFEKQQAEAQKAYEEKMQKRKDAEETRMVLEKQKDELLKKQQEERDKLMMKLGDKATENVEAGGLEETTNGKSASPVDENSSEQTKALRSQLAALEAEAKSLGIEPAGMARGRGRGWGDYRGRGQFPPRGRGYNSSYGRGGYRGTGAPRGRGGVLRLDNRPKKVTVSGVEFDAAKDEALRQYLLGIGDYDSIEPNPDRPDSLIISFKQRYVAEQLMYGPTHIPAVGDVEFTWISGPAASTETATTPATTPGAAVSGSEGKGDADAVMGNDESEMLHRHTGHEVDYDVAEEDVWAVE